MGGFALPTEPCTNSLSGCLWFLIGCCQLCNIASMTTPTNHSITVEDLLLLWSIRLWGANQERRITSSGSRVLALCEGRSPHASGFGKPTRPVYGLCACCAHAREIKINMKACSHCIHQYSHNTFRKGPAVGNDFEAISSNEPKNRAFVVSAADRIKTDRINSRRGTPRLVELCIGRRPKIQLESGERLPLVANGTTMAPNRIENSVLLRFGMA
jgi:hypothetical protein